MEGVDEVPYSFRMGTSSLQNRFGFVLVRLRVGHRIGPLIPPPRDRLYGPLLRLGQPLCFVNRPLYGRCANPERFHTLQHIDKSQHFHRDSCISVHAPAPPFPLQIRRRPIRRPALQIRAHTNRRCYKTPHAPCDRTNSRQPQIADQAARALPVLQQPEHRAQGQPRQEIGNDPAVSLPLVRPHLHARPARSAQQNLSSP